MAFTESELKECEQAIARFMARRRPPPKVRKAVDLGYRVEGQSIEIFEIRPDRRNPGNTIEIPFAKSTYVRTRDR